MLEQTRQLYLAVGDRVGLSNVSITLASHAAAQGDLKAAIEYMQPAADFGIEQNHPLGKELQAQIDRWKAELALQNPATLRPLLEQAAEEARAVNDTDQLAQVLGALVQVCEQLADWLAVAAACDELLTLQPDEPNTLYHRANAHFEVRDWAAARADYTRLTELMPDFAGAWNGLGSAHSGLAVCRRKHFQWSRMPHIGSGDPSSPQYMDSLGPLTRFSDKLLGDHAAAAEAYSRAIALTPDQPYLYRNHADALVELGQLDEAEADCQKASELEPAEPRTAGRWGQLRVAQGRFAEAEPLLRTAIAGTGLADWGGWLVLALWGQGKVDEARAVLGEWWPAADADDRTRFKEWQARMDLEVGDPLS